MNILIFFTTLFKNYSDWCLKTYLVGLLSMKTFYIHTFFFHSFTTLYLARGFSGITGSRIIAFTGFYLKSGCGTTTTSSKLDVWFWLGTHNWVYVTLRHRICEGGSNRETEYLWLISAAHTQNMCLDALSL